MYRNVLVSKEYLCRWEKLPTTKSALRIGIANNLYRSWRGRFHVGLVWVCTTANNKLHRMDRFEEYSNV